ncbi:MAG: 1-acyl-sn-glycerol-3-phosphate acyltransferase [Acidimicrobiaceae bacterium]|nr:1-acyl-sn-glycerol-3-phosphate acyltransferase [Acidimicrobiaceae bacterium]MXZ99150.1 1-acyl-sn-glycerol-3-phosphate acyltransferase [Acidimicrobiaceae bacterium]MYE98315.1 1-acyl-sn-glycerol-3-phosphate acyltransferase [Acidimicrobiaceae bacterium]MYH44763.1 1-acyl-sn-glycerol-3-phosphate acyltransferase [Acidimicrobiaceae bacterium]MYI54637.1 1-acyl-sn-glycerol-3-phosphate acyltransferase [Acidimicrobiaceae bacterium]
MGIAHDLGLVRIRSRLPSPTRALRARSFPLRAPTTPDGVEPPEKPGRTGGDFDTDWSRRWPARMCRAAIVEGPMRAMVQVLASPHRTGTDRLADLDGPAVFASNHHSHIDTPLLLTSIPEPWRHKVVVGAASDYFFGSRAAGATAALVMGAIPIERARVGRRSADLAAGLIDDGWSLLIYPEGGRSPDGWGQPFRGGAAYLSVRCGVPVVPIHVGGTGSILRKGRTMPQPAEATVTFGTPMRPEDDERAPRFASRIEDAVTALADEAGTDWYSARKRAHASTSGTLTGPEVGVWRRQWALGGRRRTPSTRTRRWPDL